MAEFLIRIRDKVGHNAMLLGEREVVSVCPDGWQWTKLEQQNPDWRIVKVPGMSVEEGDVFTAPEPVDETLYIRRRRAFKIDLTALPVSVQTMLSDDKRTEVTAELTKSFLDASKRLRTPLVRADVLAPLDVIRNGNP